MDVLTELTILVLAAFVGFEVISKVPNTLHTPLMSATNAIHGIVLLGGLLLIGEATGFLTELILVIAIAFGTINVVGGFLVTDRMLEMFRKRPEPKKAEEQRRVTSSPSPSRIRTSSTRCYIVAFSLFIYGMHLLNHPSTARRGNMVAAVGMAIAVTATLLIEEVGDYGLIALGVVVGTAVGIPAARNVKMTAMPQMVALFNGVGGGAVALIAWAEFRERAATSTPRRRSRWCSPRSSARSRSGARTSPSASSRRSSPAGRSSCRARSSSTSCCCSSRWRAPWRSSPARPPRP